MRRAAVLLDRDGTVIVEKNYLSDPDQVALEKNAVNGLRLLAGAGFALVIVSNQSGIGRGYFTAQDADRVNRRMQELLAQQGVALAGIYICPHAPDTPCACRKPAPGMALQAAADLGLDLARSFVIGDKRADLGLASAVAATGILVLTGHAADEDADWARAHGHSVAPDLQQAATQILATQRPS